MNQRAHAAIVFDLDGLLINSEAVYEDVYREVLAELGHTLPPSYYEQLVGLSADASFAVVHGHFGLTISVAELIERVETVWARRQLDGFPPMPGLFELMDAIAARGIRWGVATASERAYGERVLRQLGLDQAAGALAGGDEVAHNKPAPDVYQLAAARLNVDPTRCVALEDSAPGCRAAAAAGMTVGVIPHALTRAADFGCARYRFESLAAVIPLLDDWFG